MKKKRWAMVAIAIIVLALCAPQAQPQQTTSTATPEAKLFAPKVISTGDYDSHPAFTPDGKTLYFLKITPDFNFWTIVVSQLSGGRWREPQVAPFSGQYCDGDPFITADAQHFFFVSRRPRPGEQADDKLHDLDIWMMDKQSDGSWGKPVNIGRTVNSETSEYYPTVATNGTLYFGSRRAGGKGGTDIYRAPMVNGQYQTPENLGEAINTEFDEFEPYIAPDESYMIFMAGGGRPDSMGGYDLYISYHREGKWTKAQNLGAPFNSSADEFSPKFSPDGKYFFWSSARSVIDKPSAKKLTYAEILKRLHSPQNGLGDIYFIETSALKLER
ncbi:MAG: hypothetical protein AB1757_17420 [Acidobacteriota bacterium]